MKWRATCGGSTLCTSAWLRRRRSLVCSARARMRSPRECRARSRPSICAHAASVPALSRTPPPDPPAAHTHVSVEKEHLDRYQEQHQNVSPGVDLSPGDEQQVIRETNPQLLAFAVHAWWKTEGKSYVLRQRFWYAPLTCEQWCLIPALIFPATYLSENPGQS